MTEVLPIQGQLQFAGEIRRYIMGGNSTFTLVSKKTGQRFTYKVKSATRDRGANWSTGNQDRSRYFVSILTGPDNSGDFTYMGMLMQDINGAFTFTTTRATKFTGNAACMTAFNWFWSHIEQACQVPTGVEFWHEGSCCVCGRKLTVPESVADGIGPECRGKLAA